LQKGEKYDAQYTAAFA